MKYSIKEVSEIAGTSSGSGSKKEAYGIVDPNSGADNPVNEGRM